MARLFFITGTVKGPRGLHEFMVLAQAKSEAEAVGKCKDALNDWKSSSASGNWTNFAVDAIRTIDPAGNVESDLREAISTAQEHGHFLFVCETPMSH